MTGEHDPEVVRATLDRLFDRVAAVVAAHGGTVEKFIGDAVMAVFGVPAAHDDDAERAVRAAFELRDLVQGEQGRIPLDVRVGANTGEVVARTDAADQRLVTGVAVNLAQRLQSAAEPGEIVVGELTERLTRQAVAYAGARRIQAKGIGEVGAYRAERLLDAVPVQHRGIEGLRAPLIGRADELRAILDVYRSMATEGPARLVTIFGEAGAGKSRLAQELAQAIGSERVLWGRCPPYGRSITFWPLREVIHADAGIAPADDAVAAGGKLERLVASLIAAPDERALVGRRLSVICGLSTPPEALPDVVVESIAQELRWGLRRYVEQRATGAPLLLVIEDIHWAEPTLLDILEHLAEWVRAPLLIVCLARPELRETRPGWPRAKRAVSMDLEPLTPDETRDLIRGLLTVEALPEDLRARIAARADGNPLFVEEFLRMLIQSGAIAREGSRWVATAGLGDLTVPPTVHGIIAARLDRAPVQTKAALQRGALVGHEFLSSAVAALDGHIDVTEALLDGTRRELIVEVGERGLGGGWLYRFYHALVRDVVYASIPKADRSRMHERISRWLERETRDRPGEHAALVAHHAEQAYLLASELGLPEAPDLASRAAALLFAAATSARGRGDWRAALPLYSRYAVVARGSEEPELHRREARGFEVLGRFVLEGSPAAAAEVDRALGEARPFGPSEVLARLLLQRAHFALHADSLAAAGALYEETVAVARDVGDAELIGEALVWSMWPVSNAGDQEAAYALLVRALDEIRALGGTTSLATCLRYLASSCAKLGRFEAARRFAEEHHAAAQASGSKVERCFAQATMGRRLLDAGELVRAAELATAAFAAALELGDLPTVAITAVVAAEALLEHGEAARAETLLVQALSLVDPAAFPGEAPEIGLRLALARLALGRVGEAREAAELARSWTSPEDRYSQATTRAALARVRAAQGEIVEAESLLREALDSLAGGSMTVLDARLRHQLGEMLLDQGRVDEAREHLLLARTAYADPGAVYGRARIDELLERSEAAV